MDSYLEAGSRLEVDSYLGVVSRLEVDSYLVTDPYLVTLEMEEAGLSSS